MILVGSKPLVYGWLFALLSLRVTRPDRGAWWRPAVSGLARWCIGLLPGIPLAVLLSHSPEAAAIVLFSLFRILAWAVIARRSWPSLSTREIAAFSILATGLNTALDFTLFGGSWAGFRLGC